MNGQTVTVLTLNEVGRLLMDIHGQHEHQSLFSAVSQREILDRFGGEQIKEEADRVAALYTKWQGIRRNWLAWRRTKPKSSGGSS